MTLMHFPPIRLQKRKLRILAAQCWQGYGKKALGTSVSGHAMGKSHGGGGHVQQNHLRIYFLPEQSYLREPAPETHRVKYKLGETNPRGFFRRSTRSTGLEWGLFYIKRDKTTKCKVDLDWTMDFFLKWKCILRTLGNLNIGNKEPCILENFSVFVKYLRWDNGIVFRWENILGGWMFKYGGWMFKY